MKSKLATLTSLLSVLSVQSAFADAVTIPASSFDLADNGVAPSSTTVPFSSGAITTQILLDASLLASIPAGAEITGMSYRINAGNNPNTSQRDFNNYNLTLAPLNSSVNFGSLSTGAFANNMDMDNAVVVRSGPMSIPAGAFTSGSNPNPFSYTVSFNTNYVYGGESLAILLTHDGNTIGGGSGSAYTVDGFGSGFSGYGNSIGKTVFARFAPGFNAANGSLDSPIAVFQLTFTAIPEPGSFSALSGLAALACIGLRRRPRVRA